ncbi:MAG TPA: sigma-70 family RNA polymerase sigma factor [Thermomicrobiales bacterium]|nr:sigma-70 family RNA polymerase sigma factor [Thermomicrobiales bacterium]
MTLGNTRVGQTALVDVAAPYEAARRQLARALAEFADELGEEIIEPASAIELAARRAAVIEEGLRFFGPLRRFVRHEIERWADPIDIDAGGISVDDVVASTYVAAVDDADSAPSARAFYTWLRRIARREARAAVLEQETLQRTEVSLYTPVATVAAIGDWPDHVMRLINILADPHAQLPEEVLEQAETWAALRDILRKLPEQWREVFLLSTVDGWSDEEIALAEGIEAHAVRATTGSARAFLRGWLQSDATLAPMEGAAGG